MTPDQPTAAFRVQWQSKNEPPGDRYTRGEKAAERMARVLRLRGAEAAAWPVTVWEMP